MDPRNNQPYNNGIPPGHMPVQPGPSGSSGYTVPPNANGYSGSQVEQGANWPMQPSGSTPPAQSAAYPNPQPPSMQAGGHGFPAQGQNPQTGPMATMQSYSQPNQVPYNGSQMPGQGPPYGPTGTMPGANHPTGWNPVEKSREKRNIILMLSASGILFLAGLAFGVVAIIGIALSASAYVKSNAINYQAGKVIAIVLLVLQILLFALLYFLYFTR